MRRATVLDKKLDALLAGREPAPGDEMAAELAFMLEEVQAAFPAAVVSEQVEDLHIARIVEAAADSVAPVTAPMAPDRSSLLDRMRAGVSRRVAAASLAFTAAFGGAAYAGVLPAPVQRAVANAAGAVGLELPKPGDRDDKGSVAGDDEDRDEREAAESTDGRGDAGDRAPADAADNRRSRGGDNDGRDGDDRRGSRAGSSAADTGDRSDDDGDADDGDENDERDDDGDDRPRAPGAARDTGDRDDAEYDGPDSDELDADEDDVIEPDDDEGSSSGKGDGDGDTSDDDELEIDSDDVEDASEE